MCLLQVWAIFANFGEIHLFSSPKNLRKFRQPLDASRGHLTKSQLQKNFPRAQIISSNTWRALLLSKFKVSEKQLQSQCRFLQNTMSISPVAAVAPCALFLLLIHRAARSPGRLRASAASWPRCIAPCAAAAAPAAAAREAQRGTAPSSTAEATRDHRVAVPSPMHAAEPSS